MSDELTDKQMLAIYEGRFLVKYNVAGLRAQLATVEEERDRLRAVVDAWLVVGKWSFRHHIYCASTDITVREEKGQFGKCNCGLNDLLEKAKALTPTDAQRESEAHGGKPNELP